MKCIVCAVKFSTPLFEHDIDIILHLIAKRAAAIKQPVVVTKLTFLISFQLSYASSSPILSDRKRFPNFFRLAGPDQQQNPAKIALMKKFDWNKVATINQALELFSLVIFLTVLNALYTGGFFHCYMLNESIWHFMSVGSTLSLLFYF